MAALLIFCTLQLAADSTELRVVITRDIPFTVPLFGDDTDDSVEGRQLRDSSQLGLMRLDDEGMVIMLASTLAVVLVAITIVVVIFACIRSTDRRRTCVTSSSTAILSNAMSMTSDTKSPPPPTLLTSSSYDRKHDNGKPGCRLTNGNAKSNGTKMAACSNGNATSVDDWRRQVQQTGSSTLKQTTIHCGNDVSTHEAVAPSDDGNSKPVVVFIKDTSIADMTSSCVVDSDSDDCSVSGTQHAGITDCSTAVNQPCVGLPCPTAFSVADVSWSLPCRQSPVALPRFNHVTHDPSNHVTGDLVSGPMTSSSSFGVKFNDRGTFPRGLQVGRKVADMRQQRQGLGPVRVQQYPQPSHSLSYSDLGLWETGDLTTRTASRTVRTNNHYCSPTTQQFYKLDSRVSNTHNGRLPAYEI